VAELADALDAELVKTRWRGDCWATWKLPLLHVLADFEAVGIAMDTELLTTLEVQFAGRGSSRPRRTPTA